MGGLSCPHSRDMVFVLWAVNCLINTYTWVRNCLLFRCVLLRETQEPLLLERIFAFTLFTSCISFSVVSLMFRGKSMVASFSGDGGEENSLAQVKIIFTCIKRTLGHREVAAICLENLCSVNHSAHPNRVPFKSHQRPLMKFISPCWYIMTILFRTVSHLKKKKKSIRITKIKINLKEWSRNWNTVDWTEWTNLISYC